MATDTKAAPAAVRECLPSQLHLETNLLKLSGCQIRQVVGTTTKKIQRIRVYVDIVKRILLLSKCITDFTINNNLNREWREAILRSKEEPWIYSQCFVYFMLTGNGWDLCCSLKNQRRRSRWKQMVMFWKLSKRCREYFTSDHAPGQTLLIKNIVKDRWSHNFFLWADMWG